MHGWIRTALAPWLIAGVVSAGAAEGGVIDDGPQNLSQISSIGDLLSHAGRRPLHILYVHGMAVTGSGESLTFQKDLCAFLGCKAPAASVSVPRDYADSGPFANGAAPPVLEFLGKLVWTTAQDAQDWRASAPFVDHYVLWRGDGVVGPVVVDEINWWPLVFPLKCRNIMKDEARLAGPDKTRLDLCSQSTVRELAPAYPGRFRTYQWILPSDAKMLESMSPKGALLNRDLKSTVLDWGFSDAMMAVGSMHDLFREGMRQLFVKSARFQADGSKTDDWRRQPKKNATEIDREFIVVSHSLGSYLAFSTLNMGQEEPQPGSASKESAAAIENKAREDDAAEYIMKRTSLVYFFANQLQLLELASMGGAKPAGLTPAPGALTAQLTQWKNLREEYGQVKPPQLVSWSDPSDLLSWYVPEINGVTIANLYVRNTWWHWLFADPNAAHNNYATNEDVLRIVLGPKVPRVRSGQ